MVKYCTRKVPMSREQTLKAACLMRFRQWPCNKFTESWATYQLISEAVGLSPTAVRVMLKRYQAERESSGIVSTTPSKRLEKRSLGTRKYFGTLRQEHKDYLTSQDTLKLMVGWSLAERAAMFNSLYRDVRITRNQLCTFYRRNRISKKVVVNTKVFTPK